MKTYRVTQREVIIRVFHIEALSKSDARKQLEARLMPIEVSEAMGNGEEETESLETVEIVAID